MHVEKWFNILAVASYGLRHAAGNIAEPFSKGHTATWNMCMTIAKCRENKDFYAIVALFTLTMDMYICNSLNYLHNNYILAISYWNACKQYSIH